MAFRLAEAFIELKARGERELHKSLDKTKEKVKDVGPAADQTEKKIEKAAADAAKGVDKSATQMAKSLQKPLDKLDELEREFKTKLSQLDQRAQTLRNNISGRGADGVPPPGSNAIFGRFGLAANIVSGVAIGGIVHQVAKRANELETTGKDSEVLGPQVSREIRDIVAGIKEFGGAFKDVGIGFIDGLLGLTALMSNVASFGLFSYLGRNAASESQAEKQRISDTRAAYAARDAINAVDADAPLRNMEQRMRLDAIMKSGGIPGLEREADRLSVNRFADLQTAEQLRAVNERIAIEKERAARAGEAAAAAAEREAQAFREGGRNATWAPGRTLEIMQEAWRTGRPTESIDAERRFNLGPQAVDVMEARLRGLEQFKGFGQDAAATEKFNQRMNDRVAALIDEGNAAKAAAREYDALAAAIAKMPAGAGKDAAMKSLGEARINVDAFTALEAEKRQNRERQERERREGDFAGRFAQGNVQAALQEFDFLQRMQARPTTGFQVVDVADFANKLQADIFAKEDEQMRIQEEKRMHEEAQDKREAIVEAVEGVTEAVGRGLAAVFS